jgi:membrane-bound lytic murein transglycosylase D
MDRKSFRKLQGLYMRSTGGLRPRREDGRWLLAGFLGWLLVGTVHAANTLCPETTIPRPQALEKDVRFWVRVYTEVDTNSGFLHDQYNLAVVYEALHFPSDSSPHERQSLVDTARERINASLRRIAATSRDADLSAEDRRIKALFGPDASSRAIHDAIDNVRFQLGQSDRFQAGLRRSGAWEKHIEETLAGVDKEDGGLPCELAVLPHVESNFNYTAYSKAGAAGMWQFMRSTGRRYLRIDSSVDERMDPFRATQAAAQLLDYNYRLLGTWPLALTAYNSGAGGMRRAKEELNTDDIVKIVREYHGPTFGFASRNYYVSFLAALEVDRNPEKYFPHLVKDPEVRFQQVAVPAFVQAGALERALKIDGLKLRELNPALLHGVWEGRRRIPRNYMLRLPLDGQHWTSELIAQHLRPSELYAGPAEASRRHRVTRGETLASLAEEFGISADKLARANRLRAGAKLTAGRVLTIPAALVPVADAGRPEPVATPVRNELPSATPRREPESPSGGPVLARADVTNIYVVEPGDSFSDIASRHGLSQSDLLRLNGLRNEDFIAQGQELVVKGTPASAGTVPMAAASPPAARIGTPVAAPPVPVTPAPPAPVAAAAPAPAAAVTSTSVAVPESPASVSGSAVSALVSDTVGAGQMSGGAVPAEEAQREVDEDEAAAANAPSIENTQPVSAAQAEELAPSVGPAHDTQQNPDPTDYTIARDGSIHVAATESLGQYAEWLDVTPAHLAQLNHMRRGGRPLDIGSKIRLDFHSVSQKQFEAKRRHYHQSLQAAFFAAHRIVGTAKYVARKGDTYWHISQRYSKVPIWLMQQYNPDVDLTDVHPGVKLVVPRVEAIERSDDN